MFVEGRVVDRSSHDCLPGARVEIADVPEAVLPPLPAGSHSEWTGLIDAPPWPAGELWLSETQSLEFVVGECRDGLAVVRLQGSECDARTLCRALAAAEMPLVGDLEGGGLGVAGGVRLVASAERNSPSIDWPEEPAWLAATEDPAGGRDPETSPPRFRVSDETARMIRKGHPWILGDGASDSAARFRSGTLVRVVSRAGGDLAWARIEGDRRLAARIWAVGALASRRVPSVEARVARALSRRRSLLVEAESTNTNAFRLIHGEGDALPGLVVDRLGPLLRVLVTGRASDRIRDRVLAALRAQLPLTPDGQPWSILELSHLRAAGRGEFDRLRWLAGGPEALAEAGLQIRDGGIQVLERGLRFGVDPGWETPRKVRPGYGLFLDQRENRARLEPHAARGGDWLNLFAHTGAFSVSLLAAGAERVISVDLSAAYLKRLEANLSANRDRGVDPSRHESVRVEGRRFLETLGPQRRFAGIVLDPPTAAAAGHRFWSLRRDLEPLLQQCVERLQPGGVLLVTQNCNGPPLGLNQILERIVDRAQRSIERLEPAPAGLDHPSLAGFPEGDPFEGWLLRLV